MTCSANITWQSTTSPCLRLMKLSGRCVLDGAECRRESLLWTPLDFYFNCLGFIFCQRGGPCQHKTVGTWFGQSKCGWWRRECWASIWHVWCKDRHTSRPSPEIWSIGNGRHLQRRRSSICHPHWKTLICICAMTPASLSCHVHLFFKITFAHRMVSSGGWRIFVKWRVWKKSDSEVASLPIC